MLLWPEPAALLAQTHDNHARLAKADRVMIQNVPLSELRRAQRQWLGHEDDQPLIATGHQIELRHPGVWAKDVLINELAAKLDGVAFHFAVDADAPKHLSLRWPGGSWPITDDPRVMTADWAGTLEAPSPAHLAHLSRELSAAAAAWDFEPMAIEYLDSLRQLTLESTNLTWVLTNASHALDWKLGLRQHASLVSPLLVSPGYLTLVHHILGRADSFLSLYNAVLGEYRRDMAIDDPGRPWPDLRCAEGGCEVPFWLDCLETGQRRRATVERPDGRWLLRWEDERFEFDPASDGHAAADALGRFFLRQGVRLSPRALTLTMFLRLLVADQFVHGIGGGRYDGITDRVIERWFGLQPPAFSVTTATLLFPSAAGQTKVDLPAIQLEGRRLRHQWASEHKRQLAQRISTLPRGSQERRRLFYDMHHALNAGLHSASYEGWQQCHDKARRTAALQQDIFDRELFYALQPEPRLRGLIDRYRNAVRS